ncbi:gamma-glutamyltranspeptidase / glutathione hydrolase [Gillisia sp. Hel1_33_143]|uniref:gamma-glutamyltransferase n=1 Tax=Gillisia sp. Hel1_33_143 TaxID=1336796 RepID=UPI00087B9237|nr:gamma-glutamyltransferase [Gillisia sp. Hel1_33_143]SDS80992.1 gamma-glutamyltranspeptidase / glutathione hydrolase [Gillisia sp. Hel1_33_143]
MRRSFLFLLLASFVACKSPKVPENFKSASKELGLIADKAMVVSAREEASKIASDIMQQGGNAFDAMVVTEMALAVSYPFAGSLGGGGFMVYRKANGEIGSLDFREKAPLAASKNMYLNKDGNAIPEKSQLGALAVGVPGNIAGIFAAHEKLGSLPISKLLAPVISLAREGYVVTQKQAASFNEYLPKFKTVNNKTILYSKIIKAGDTIKNIALANTLQRISENGRSEFYGGETGQKLVQLIKDHGGIITLEDLLAYKAKWRTPVTFNYKGLKVISMAPPSSGGVALAQIMKMIEPYPLEKFGHNQLQTIQVITEAERRAYADRSYYLGDPDFYDVPLDIITGNKYLLNRMNTFSFEKATPSSELEHGEISGYESNETTHYSIVDQYGNAIAVTTTLNGAFGSKLYSEELGFFLNNEMDDFSVKPGVPNMFGLIGADANAIEPQKTMLSSMTPTIVEKDGKFWMSVGTPGGSTIITSVLQTILNVHDFGMTMQEAVNAPRFHHQWLPDEIMFEPKAFNKDILLELQSKGYNINERDARIIGKVDGILKMPNGKLEGGADKRGDDTAVGF